MSLHRKFEPRLNTPAKPQPLPLAQEPEETATECPACSVAIRPGAVLCVNCGARLGRIETVVPPGLMTRAPCPGCGYDLSGVSGTKCPECGGHAPFAAAPLEVMTEAEEWMAGRVLWETCRNAVWAGGAGLAVMLILAGVWYGPQGIQFWLAAVIPTWIVASIGYLVLGAILRFLDTTIPIALLQVLGVTLVGLAITELVFPYSSGRIYSTRTWLLVPVMVTGATMLCMDDDDRWDCFFASLPIMAACVAVPAVLLAIVG